MDAEKIDKSKFEDVIKKKKKFVPSKTPRYLVGSVDTVTLNNDLVEYNKHRKNIFQAVTKTDDQPPKFFINNYIKIVNITADAVRLRTIERENVQLLLKINMINRTKGKIDTFNQNAYRSSSKWSEKESEFRKIRRENKKIYKRLIDAKSVYPKSEHDKFWEKISFNLENNSRYGMAFLKRKSVDEELKALPSISTGLKIQEDKRLKCFLEFQIKNGLILGKVVVSLYNDILPKTVAYFLETLRGERQNNYKKCPLNKIYKNKYCIVGLSKKYDPKDKDNLKEENFMLKHTKAGVLSMLPIGHGKVNYQFTITFNEMKEFDGKRVAFGKIIWGAKNLFKVNDMGNQYGRPEATILISDCGEITM